MKLVTHLKISCLAGLALSMLATAGYSAPPKDISFQVNQFVLSGELPTGEERIGALLQSAQGKTYTLFTLQDLTKQIEQIIRDDGYSFYRVVLPPQSLADGEVTFNIISFSLGNIEVTGNEYFDRSNILRSLPALKHGTPLNTRKLTETLWVANHHPSKQAKITFKQSKTEDKIDADINVADERPYHAALIMNNAGTRESGYYRLTGAVEHNNLWNWDHRFNASYTTSPDHADSVIQYGASYDAPIYPLQGMLSGYYVFSDIATGIVAGDFDVSGSGEMYGISYKQYLPRIEKYEHWLSVGIDNRFFDNNIQFALQQIGTDVRSTPISLSYRAEYPWETARLGFNVQWARNLGFGSFNSQRDYSATRFGAKEDWNTIRYGLDFSAALGQWLLKATLTGQYSPDALIPGEQIGLGGTYSIRGYQERESSADSGQIVHLEIYSPRWYGANLLAFFDYGHGTQSMTLPQEPDDWNIGSLGVGARWQWRSNVFASIDWAYALFDAPPTQQNNTEAGDSRIHFSVVLRY